jgi:hypothetical protein
VMIEKCVLAGFVRKIISLPDRSKVDAFQILL